MFLKFSKHEFHVTPCELFMSPFNKNQYDFVEIDTFYAGMDAPASQPIAFCLLENALLQ